MFAGIEVAIGAIDNQFIFVAKDSFGNIRGPPLSTKFSVGISGKKDGSYRVTDNVDGTYNVDYNADGIQKSATGFASFSVLIGDNVHIFGSPFPVFVVDGPDRFFLKVDFLRLSAQSFLMFFAFVFSCG